ncbi:MAG: hypothetical protein IKP73_18660 [Bacteroidales bacterium]|nr:hypothetical protein [Bacteroidales bacterium]MBR4327539.1 hypothetical protein [Bacteroidales bacterium]
MNNLFVNELNIINRTYLFYNDRKELEKETSLHFSQANNAAKSGFEKRYLAFEKLSKYAKEVCNLELKKLLEIYQNVSEQIDKEGIRRSRVKKADIFGVVSKYISDEKSGTDSALTATVRFLILAGLLPKTTSKQGGSKNIRKDFERMIDFFEDYCRTAKLMSYNHLDIHRENLADADDDALSRILLIDAARNILQSIKNFNNRKSLFEAAKNFQNVRCDLEGVYSRYDGDSPSDFWYVYFDEERENNYFLVHFYKNKTTGRLEYVCYVGLLRKYLDLQELTVFSDKYWRILCENSGIEDSDETVRFWVDFSKKTTKIYPSDDGKIKKITFDRVYSKGVKLPLKTLYRVENFEDYFQLTDTAENATDDKYLHDITGTLYAITSDYFYISLTETDMAALKTDKKYLKVPRTEDLSLCDNIHSEVFLVHFGDGAVYLAFYHLNKFYDLRKCGFEFTDNIL